MTAFFITATGTEIGKTYVTQQLLHWDRKQALSRLLACKPVISDWSDNSVAVQQSDTGLLLSAQQMPLTRENINDLSPWRFALPLTPSMAAAQEGKEIDWSALLAYCHKKINQAQRIHKIAIFEGAGGLMSPITACYTGLDWMAQLACACLLVVGSYLGSLSHTLTAMMALQAKNIKVLAIVVNETAQSGVTLAQTCAFLADYFPGIAVLPLPRGPALLAERAIATIYTQVVQDFF